MVCSHCGCSDIDKDPARGDAVCTGCGSVLEDQIIVSEVQFQENSAGGASVIGQYVSSEGPKGNSMAAGFHHGLGKESRAITLQNGKRRIQHTGDQLRLNQHCIDTAYNFFKMAVNRRLTRGRKSSHIHAACLYLTCRTEGTSHMLLDFSDVLQTNVYLLGRTYLQLSKELCINVPALDPCLYIHRFAHKLEFADKTHEVSMTALRLVSRMKRDWMAQGRRPSGLCGAALLVAARIHDFNRSIKEIIKVVRIGEGTVRKRLAEFEATPSSQLTIDEFQRIDLEEEMDPPCFSEGKRKAKLAQLESEGRLTELTSEIQELQEEIDQALEDAVQRKHKRHTHGDTSSVCSTAPSVADLDDELSTASQFINNEIVESVNDMSNPGSPSPAIDGADDPDIRSLEDAELKTVLRTLSGSLQQPDLGPRPTAASLGLTESIDECMKVCDNIPVEEDDGELDLTDIDDEELDRYILSEKEVAMKTRIWTAANEDYLKELAEKQARDAQLEKEGCVDPKKKRKPRRKPKSGEANSAGEAIEKMLQEKKISNKINYDVLRNLNQSLSGDLAGPGQSSPKKEEQDIKPPMSPIFGEGPVTATPVNLSTNRFKRPMDLRMLKKDNILPAAKKAYKVEANTTPKISPQEPSVVVESGPVDYNVEQEEEDDDDDEEECLSAAQLMGHGTVDDDYGDYDDDY